MSCIEQTQASFEQLHSWVADGQLYAVIDGLEKPELESLADRYYPRVDTALYGDFFDGQYRQISPHILQVNEEVLQWLKPIIEQDPAWGWFMLPRLAHRNLPVSSLLQKLIDHFRLWCVLPNKLGKGTTLFRLQDASVLQRWFIAAEAKFIEAFMGPLEGILIYDGHIINVVSLTDKETPEVVIQLPLQPWSATTLNALDVQHKDALMESLMQHLRDHHSATREWEDDKLRQFVVDNSNKAHRHGFDTPSAMAKYLSICAELGIDFVDDEWAQSVLKNSSSDDRSDVIDELVKQAANQLDKEQAA